LAESRIAAGLTQSRLAEIVGSTQTRVSDWERGVSSPHPALIPPLAAAVGLDALVFLGADPGNPSLGDLRLAAGLSRHRLAAEIGISDRRYQRLEVAGSRKAPEGDVVRRLATLLSVPAVMIRRAIEASTDQ
jgi:transcriptional regulator with XRE-family HTH domain